MKGKDNWGSNQIKGFCGESTVYKKDKIQEATNESEEMLRIFHFGGFLEEMIIVL